MWQWSKSKGCYVNPVAAEENCGKVHADGPWAGGAARPLPSAGAGVTDTLIHNNKFVSQGVGSRAGLTLTSNAATDTWAFNFCPNLIFQRIDHVRSVTVTPASGGGGVGGPLFAWADQVAGCNVTAKTNVAVAGSVFVEVDSSKSTGLLI